MWIFDWFKSTLQGLGLLNKSAKIVFLGLDDAGKSTLLLMLKNNIMRQVDPTEKPYSEELTMAWDLGGHVAARKTWKNYMVDIGGIVYLVDCSNPKRFEQSSQQLQGILDIPQLEKVPIVILGNKIDKMYAVPESQLREALGLQQQKWDPLNKEARPIQVFMCSIPKKIGYADGFKWMSSFIK